MQPAPQMQDNGHAGVPSPLPVTPNAAERCTEMNDIGAKDRDYEARLWAESRDIASFLDALDDADVDKDCLCDGWRVRDVVSLAVSPGRRGAVSASGDDGRPGIESPASRVVLVVFARTGAVDRRPGGGGSVTRRR